MNNFVIIIENESIKRKPSKELREKNNFIYNLFYRIKRKISTKLNFIHEDLNKIENKWL